MPNDIKKFLERVVFSKEISLMIAEDEKSLKELEQKVSDAGFQKNQTIREIFNFIEKGLKGYFILKNELGNNLYNILSQYPTGQINAFDGLKNLVVSPNHQTGAVLILITKENLKIIEKGEKSLLKIVGLTWVK